MPRVIVVLLLFMAAPVQSQRPAFEVAAIRQNRSGEQAWSMTPSPGGRVDLINVPLRIVIRAAFGGLQDDQLVDGPAWLETERFDIVARAAGNVPQNQLLLMLRTLLEDRFRLRLREEMREMPIYALAPGNAGGAPGPQLRRAAPCYRVAMNAPAEAAPPPGSLPPCGFTNGPGSVTGRGATLERLAFSLSQRAGRFVVDRTGLGGEFDFDLTFSPDDTAGDLPSIFTAVREQLGLRLEPARGPVPVFVIDRLERPTEN